MPWIKRNLFLVISAGIGLILMAGAGYFLWCSLEANSAASDEFKAAVGELNKLKQANPYPSDENIQAAKQDQQRVREFAGQVRALFSPLPAPPKVDEKSFRVYLHKTISQMQADAKSAGVLLPDQYAFSFSAIYSASNERLVFPAESIEPWMTQLQEIKAICDVLFQAKVNCLEGLRRVPVSKDDQGTSDYLAASMTTNQLGVVTPYEVTFRGFSSEIASVMDSFLRATNCFVVRCINVMPANGLANAAPATAATQAGGPSRAGMEGAAAPALQAGARPGYRLPATAGGSVTVVSERPLHVTMVVEMIQLKAPEQ